MVVMAALVPPNRRVSLSLEHLLVGVVGVVGLIAVEIRKLGNW